MNRLKLLASKLTLFSVVTLLISLVFSIAFGVYFLGDTVTHLQFAEMGGPLTTFIQHHALWPPLFSLVLNLISHLPINPYFLASIFVSSILLFYVFFTSVFVRLVGFKWKTALIISSLTLVGPMSLIMKSFISEPLFIVSWMLTLILTIKFLRTTQEKWLVLWLIPAFMMPLTRYMGAVVVAWFSLVIFLKLVNDIRIKSKENYSKWMVLMSLGVVWFPLSYYLFRNKIQIGTPFATRDLNTLYSSSEIAVRYLSTIWKDMSIIALITFLFGMSLARAKKYKNVLLSLLLTLGSGLFYLLGLYISENKYAVLPYIPSRYIGISYPFIILSFFFGGLLIGQHLIKKYKFKIKPIHMSLSLVLISGILLFSAYFNINRLNQEKETIVSMVPKVAWTGDLKQLCNNSKQQYLIAHIHSRNWIAWSYSYLCEGIVTLKDPETITLSANSSIISAYEIKSETLVENNQLVINGYTTYFYEVTTSTDLDLNKIFSERIKFE